MTRVRQELERERNITADNALLHSKLSDYIAAQDKVIP